MPNGQQTLRPFLTRAVAYYPDKEIVSRTADGIHRYSYADYGDRAAQLAHALDNAGLATGDRIGTVAWNHHRHLETYFGVPCSGAQIHTVNPLLSPPQIEYIVENAEDRVLFVDPSFLPKIEPSADSDAFATVEQYVVMGESVPDTSLDPVTDYESFITGHPTEYDWPELDEDQPAGLCYTSGTTGPPKGAEYTHQMLWAHTMMALNPQAVPLQDHDVVMPVVPMFHVNAWGIPFTTTAVGAQHVLPGPSPDPADIVGLIENERVTFSAAVPTVWIALFEYMNDHDVDLSSLERVAVGGSAAPEAMIRRFDEHDVTLIHAWGMTEMAPIGSVAHVKDAYRDADYETQMQYRVKQGMTIPGLEFKVVDDDGNEVPRDGESFGELLVRGPTIIDSYFKRPDTTETDFADGWLKTGDIVTVDPEGYLQIVDRAKDVIKSGGEWISSVDLENTLMAHDAVNEATVIGVPHERWQERPAAFIVPAGSVDKTQLEAELRELIEERFPKWWAPDTFEIIDEVPKTATGKFDKKQLRDDYSDESLVAGKVPEDAAPKTD